MYFYSSNISSRIAPYHKGGLTIKKNFSEQHNWTSWNLWEFFQQFMKMVVWRVTVALTNLPCIHTALVASRCMTAMTSYGVWYSEQWLGPPVRALLEVYTVSFQWFPVRVQRTKDASVNCKCCVYRSDVPATLSYVVFGSRKCEMGNEERNCYGKLINWLFTERGRGRQSPELSLWRRLLVRWFSWRHRIVWTRQK